VSPIGITRSSNEPYQVPKAVLPFVASCDANIEVASTEVKIGVDLCTAKLVKKVCDNWDQVLILSGDLVEVPEVDTESQGTILLLGKEDRCVCW